jgi:hypothetical protein
VGKRVEWRCRLTLTFFGLDDRYHEGVYEELFSLKQHGNWSFFEAYSLPIVIRRWFLKRLAKHFEEQRKAAQKSSKTTTL